MNDLWLKNANEAIQSWFKEIREFTVSSLNQIHDVSTKSSRTDLVTDVDKSNERFFIKKIREFDSEAHILGEEGFGDDVTNLDGHVWIVDPIDGTMNFVKQHNHFAIMLALYIDGKEELGYILDVMNDKLYHNWDGKVYENDTEINPPEDISLSEGLMGLSGPLLINNEKNMQAISKASEGARIYGSAGIQIIAVLKGELVGYISTLKPWDIAAGKVLCDTLGIKVSDIDGNIIDVVSSDIVLVATKIAQKDILNIIKYGSDCD